MSEEIILSSAIPLISHPAIVHAIEIYLENGKSIESVEKFFAEDHSCSFPKEELENFFDKVSEESLSQVKKDLAIIELQKRSLEMDSQASNRIIMMQEIAWDRMSALYVNTEPPVSKEQKNMHMKQTKEFCELAKMYREYHAMRLEIIGMGKTEEEAKSDMETFVTSLLKDAINHLGEFPDAQNKLSAYLNLTVIPESDGDNGAI